jgi:hypothetical protein
MQKKSPITALYNIKKVHAHVYKLPYLLTKKLPFVFHALVA